jgi:3-deoxy-7-phosphoheptulonate synthase
MIIVLKPDATQNDIEHIIGKLEDVGLKAHISKGKERTIIGAIGDERVLREQSLDTFPGVENVVPILKPYKLVSREFQSENSIIDVKGIKIGGNEFQIIAGPCTVENKEILLETALEVKKAGARFLRGGAFKPRTSPYSFQGLGEQGLDYLSDVSSETGLLIVTELMDPRDTEMVYKHADIIQIGTRNMQNFRLLTEVGKLDKPILLKRGMSATIKELLMSAEYIASEGNKEIILCERGIRTFEGATRNTLDISAIPVLKEETHLPVIVDPSHAVGKWHLVSAVAKASVAAGADGLIIEVHADPENAVCDGSQSLKPKTFSRLVGDIRKLCEVEGRSFS